MGTYASYGILVLCICFIQAFGSERCTYPDEDGNYHHCSIGSCCKKRGTWYCTRLGDSTTDCQSFSEITTRRPKTTTTTEAPKGRTYVSGYAIVGVIAGVVFVAVMVHYAIRYGRKHTNPSPVVRSPAIAIIYKV